MATFTEHYNLTLPEAADFYDVDVFNENFETLDEAVGLIETEAADINQKIGQPEDGETIFQLLQQRSGTRVYVPTETVRKTTGGVRRPASPPPTTAPSASCCTTAIPAGPPHPAFTSTTASQRNTWKWRTAPTRRKFLIPRTAPSIPLPWAEKPGLCGCRFRFLRGSATILNYSITPPPDLFWRIVRFALTPSMRQKSTNLLKKTPLRRGLFHDDIGAGTD